MRQRGTSIAQVFLRNSEPQDQAFLYSVYASSRAGEMTQLADWSEQQKADFLQFQFKAQDRHYKEHHPDASYEIIVAGDTACGRLYVDEMPAEFRLMDIALLPAYQGRGIGRALVQDIMLRARTAGKFMSLHVEDDNPAKKLYEKLGFEDAGQVSFYTLMHWHPPL